MAIFYPRKQTVIIFLVCVLAVWGTTHYASLNANAGQINGAGNNNSAAVVTDLQPNTSTDNGDWKKQFEGTVKTPPNSDSAITKEKLTATDNLARDFFTSYIGLKQADLVNDQDAIDQTTANIAAEHINTNPTKLYVVGDLHTIAANDKNTLLTFSQAVTTVLDSYNIRTSQSSIVQSYISKNDPSVLKNIDPIIAAYKRMISSLLAIPTPEIISSQYLELVNALSTMKSAAVDFRGFDTDSVSGLSGMSMHVTGAQQIITGLQDMNAVLEGEGVPFMINQNALNALVR